MTSQVGGYSKPIIFFDGVCGMCNTFVDVVLRLDKKGQFLFAPLQGDTAKSIVPPLSDNPLEWSLIYLDEKGLHDQSDASLAIYRRMGGLWSVLALARFVPVSIRTPIYRMIARNRYRWFGKKSACRIPTAEERSRFLP